MIVAPKFPGDDDAFVQEIQHRVYRECIGLLASEVCRAFIFASQVAEGSENLSAKLKVVQTKGCDHRIVQTVHDQIAGRFRQSRHNKLQPILSLDGPVCESERIESDWREFWAYAVRCICEDASTLRVAAECIATSGGMNDSVKEELLLRLVTQRFSITKS